MSVFRSVARYLRVNWDWRLEQHLQQQERLRMMDPPPPKKHLPPPVGIGGYLRANAPVVPAPGLPLADVQGIIFRGYKYHQHARHFCLRISDIERTKAWIGSLVNRPGTPLQINTAKEWHGAMPDVLLNLGMTYEALEAFKIPGLDMQKSFVSFQDGAPKNAEIIGDTGESSPKNWIGDLGGGTHFVLSLYALNDAILDRYSSELRAGFAECLTEQYSHDANALPDHKVHFGYRDSISQPHVRGVGKEITDDQPVVPPYYFIIMDHDLAPYNIPTPNNFWLNGTFGAFRILKQDVHLFNDYLESQSHLVPPEKLKAQFCGRWDDGTPLHLSPGIGGCVPEAELNRFNYSVPFEDSMGTKCPYGSHLRRTNARMGTVLGGVQAHRVMRRAIPFGPPDDDPSEENRGLVGYFMGVDIQAQFEFIMQQWVNHANFTSVIEQPSGFDPLIGMNDGTAASVFDVMDPYDGSSIRVKNIPRFVTTMGSAYCFLPSITGLKYLAKV